MTETGQQLYLDATCAYRKVGLNDIEHFKQPNPSFTLAPLTLTLLTLTAFKLYLMPLILPPITLQECLSECHRASQTVGVFWRTGVPVTQRLPLRGKTSRSQHTISNQLHRLDIPTPIRTDFDSNSRTYPPSSPSLPPTHPPLPILIYFIAGIVDIPNACATIGLPLEAFDFNILPQPGTIHPFNTLLPIHYFTTIVYDDPNPNIT